MEKENFQQKKKLVMEYLEEAKKKGKIPLLSDKYIKEHSLDEIKSYIDNCEAAHAVTTKGFGMSYVILYKILAFIFSILISFFVAFLVGINFISYRSSGPEGIVLIIIAIILSGIIYYCLSFFIKLFENIAIIAKNTSILVARTNQKEKDE